MNRRPPAKVLKALRKEVGFACPMCGSPFLTWHHFDPPWRERQHHNPRGMIALCPEHAAHADGGHITVQQLRDYKRPLNDEGIVAAKWPWSPEKAIFILGNSLLLGQRPILSLMGSRVLGIRKSALLPVKTPFFSIDADFRDGNGNKLLELNDNLLSFYGASLEDVVCPPQARFFKLKNADGNNFLIRHERVSAGDDLCAYLKRSGIKNIPDDFLRVSGEKATDSEGKVPIIEMEGDVLTEHIDLHFSKKESSMVCKFYKNERVVLDPRVFYEGGSLSLNFGKKEIIRFG